MKGSSRVSEKARGRQTVLLHTFSAYTIVFLISVAARPFDLRRSSLGLFRLSCFTTLTDIFWRNICFFINTHISHERISTPYVYVCVRSIGIGGIRAIIYIANRQETTET